MGLLIFAVSIMSDDVDEAHLPSEETLPVSGIVGVSNDDDDIIDMTPQKSSSKPTLPVTDSVDELAANENVEKRDLTEKDMVINEKSSFDVAKENAAIQDVNMLEDDIPASDTRMTSSGSDLQKESQNDPEVGEVAIAQSTETDLDNTHQNEISVKAPMPIQEQPNVESNDRGDCIYLFLLY